MTQITGQKSAKLAVVENAGEKASALNPEMVVAFVMSISASLTATRITTLLFVLGVNVINDIEQSDYKTLYYRELNRNTRIMISSGHF